MDQKWVKTVEAKNGRYFESFFVEICSLCHRPYLSSRFVVVSDDDYERWQQEMTQNKKNSKKIGIRMNFLDLIYIAIASIFFYYPWKYLFSKKFVPDDVLLYVALFFVYIFFGFITYKISKNIIKKLNKRFPELELVRKEILSKLIADKKLCFGTGIGDIRLQLPLSICDYQLISETTFKQYPQYEEDINYADPNIF